MRDRHRHQSQVLSLREDHIDLFLEWLEKTQERVGVDKSNRIRVRLLVEELLLRMHDALGSDVPLSAACETRLGRTRLLISVRGSAYNPLVDVEPELGDWDSSLRTAINITPQYAYVGGQNSLRLTLPGVGMNPVLRIAQALLLGTLAGFAGALLLPDQWLEVIVDVLLQPTYDVWFRMLNAISGPIIFCTVLTTMLNTRRIDERGGSSLVVIGRYFALSILIVTLALLCALPFFGVGYNHLQLNPLLVRGLLNLLVEAVPANVVDPFVESNTSQLICIALALGYVLIRLRDQTTLLRRGIREANVIGLKFADVMSRFVPIFAGAFVCFELWRDDSITLLGMWSPAVVALVTSVLIMAAASLLLAFRLQTSPLTLLRKLWAPFAKALQTGSLDASFAEAQNSCTNLLGIDKGYVKVGLPQGLVLYMPMSAVGTIMFTLYVARLSEVQGDVLWYTFAVVMAVVVFVATPPVPGANLLAYVVLFNALGIPEDALLDALVFDVVFGIFAGAANQAMLQLEMTLQASRLGLLNRDVLSSPVRR